MIGVWAFFDAMPADDTAAFAQRVENWGYGTLWIPEATGREALASSSHLLSSTTKLNIATGIANIYARDAMTMAAGRNTLAEQSGGRFLLGIGVSHRPLVQGMRGHDYSKPLSYMRNYLDKMENAPYTSLSASEPAPIVIGALHPKMLKLAADRTQGAHPYLVPPEHTAFARETMGPDAWICTEQKVLFETDATKARATARQAVAMYLGLPNYRRSLERFGYSGDDFENMGSNRLIDAIVAWGDEDAIRTRIKAHQDAGATHVCVQTIHPDNSPLPDERILDALAPG